MFAMAVVTALVGPLSVPAPDSTVLGAATQHIHSVWTKSSPGRILQVDPRRLVPDLTPSAAASAAVGQTAFGPDTNVTAGMARAGAIETPSLARARACDAYAANNCMQRNAFLTVAYGAPTITGDSATVVALVRLTEAPNPDAAPGSRASKGTKGFTIMHLTLHRRDQQWTVSGMKVVVQS